MAVITDPDLLKILEKESEDRIYHIYNKIMTTEYPTDPRFLDLSGQDFGYIHVDKYCGKDEHGMKYFHCTCNYCGFPTIMSNSALNFKSDIKTCGCYKYHHGDTYNRLNKIYFGMLHRCYNKESEEYYRYGGRGIKVCDEWLGPDGYLNFKKFALSTGYNENLSLDRIDIIAQRIVDGQMINFNLIIRIIVDTYYGMNMYLQLQFGLKFVVYLEIHSYIV